MTPTTRMKPITLPNFPTLRLRCGYQYGLPRYVVNELLDTIPFHLPPLEHQL